LKEERKWEWKRLYGCDGCPVKLSDFSMLAEFDPINDATYVEGELLFLMGKEEAALVARGI